MWTNSFLTLGKHVEKQKAVIFNKQPFREQVRYNHCKRFPALCPHRQPWGMRNRIFQLLVWCGLHSLLRQLVIKGDLVKKQLSFHKQVWMQKGAFLRTRASCTIPIFEGHWFLVPDLFINSFVLFSSKTGSNVTGSKYFSLAPWPLVIR